MTYYAVIETIIEVDAKTKKEAERKAGSLQDSIKLLFSDKLIDSSLQDLAYFEYDGDDIL